MVSRRLQDVSWVEGADQNRTGELALTRKLRTFEVSPREREDEARRQAHEEHVDSWGYDCWHEDGWTELPEEAA